MNQKLKEVYDKRNLDKSKLSQELSELMKYDPKFSSSEEFKNLKAEILKIQQELTNIAFEMNKE